MDLPAAIHAVIQQQDLTATEMRGVMNTIMTGKATPAQIGGFLVGLRMKGETVEEITSSAQVMRELALQVSFHHPHLVDTCGTGGDGAVTFNISTCGAFVVAAAGGKVAKHGNRSMSSKSGSADVLEKAGAKIDLNPEQVAACIEQIGVGFMFAPMHHGAMKHAIGPRREMGVRTIFNLLGPLTNPAGVVNQVVGVYSVEWVTPICQVLKQLGAQHVLVVHAEDGLDEISIGAATRVAELYKDQIQHYMVTPEEFGLKRGSLQALKVDSPAASLDMIQRVFNNEPGPARDIVVLNAGAAIYAANLEKSLAQGVRRAIQALDSGQAKQIFHQFIEFTRQFAAVS